jgi:hypothetical protein
VALVLELVAILGLSVLWSDLYTYILSNTKLKFMLKLSPFPWI